MRASYLSLVALLIAAAHGDKAEDTQSAAAELLEVSESTNNNTATVGEEPAEKSNSKRTIDHNLGYGYRYNTVLRPVPVPLPTATHYLRRPIPKAPRYPYASQPFRYSQPLAAPRDEPRPVTEMTPSAPHADTVYRTLPSHAHTFSFDEEAASKAVYEGPKLVYEPAKPSIAEGLMKQQEQPEAAGGGTASSYQQVLQHLSEQPTYLHAPHAMYSSAAMFSPSAHAHAHTHMIPVIIVRLMDTHAAASSASAPLAMAVSGAQPYPLLNMHYLRDYLSKLYAGPDTLMYLPERPAPMLQPAQLHRLHLQQQLQQLQQIQQQRQSVAALLQEQHRQRVAASAGRTEISVHRSPAMSPQDYKDSVEQQEEA